MLLKACPRCGGALNPQSDRYGEYLCCLQCGQHYEDRSKPQPLYQELRDPSQVAQEKVRRYPARRAARGA